MNTNPIQITIVREIPLQDIQDLLITALEGGSNYWLHGFRVEITEPGAPKPTIALDYTNEQYTAPIVGTGRLIIHHDSGDNDAQETILDRQAIERGLVRMAVLYPKHMANLLDGNADAETADVWLQLCIFDKLIFG